MGLLKNRLKKPQLQTKSTRNHLKNCFKLQTPHNGPFETKLQTNYSWSVKLQALETVSSSKPPKMYQKSCYYKPP